MATYSKLLLSQSTDGLGIGITATGTAGTLIHVPPTGTSSQDEVWIYSANTHTTEVKLTIEWGGVSSPDNLIETLLDVEAGLYLSIPGLVIRNSQAIRAFTDVYNVINIHGFVNRITE